MNGRRSFLRTGDVIKKKKTGGGFIARGPFCVCVCVLRRWSPSLANGMLPRLALYTAIILTCGVGRQTVASYKARRGTIRQCSVASLQRRESVGNGPTSQRHGYAPGCLSTDGTLLRNFATSPSQRQTVRICWHLRLRVISHGRVRTSEKWAALRFSEPAALAEHHIQFAVHLGEGAFHSILELALPRHGRPGFVNLLSHIFQAIGITMQHPKRVQIARTVL